MAVKITSRFATQRTRSQGSLEKVNAEYRWAKNSAAVCPSVVSRKLRRKNMAAASVAATAMILLFQKPRVSLAPWAMLSASIRLTKPDEALQIIASNPRDKNFVYPRVRSRATVKITRREPWGRYVVIHSTRFCQRLVVGSQPTMEASTRKNGTRERTK